MELFNSTGFEVTDKVFTMLDDVKYFGFVTEIDDKRDRIKVDYSAKGEKAIDWFHKSFWTKTED
nr:hypothetical protein [uncultured Flavobacterium sp.]